VSTTSKRSLLAALLFTGLGLAGVSPALATAVDVVPNPYTVTNGSTSGSLVLVDSFLGAPTDPNTITFAGPFAGISPTDITMVFQLTATAGSIEDVGVSVVVGFSGRTVTGHGTISGTGEVSVTSGPFTNTLLGGTAGFDFGVPGLDSSNASADTSDYFFVSFSNVTADGTENVRLMVDPGSGADYSVTGPQVVVPEPSGLLMILGAGALAAAAWTRRSRARRC
jgi:hypothetical protein